MAYLLLPSYQVRRIGFVADVPILQPGLLRSDRDSSRPPFFIPGQAADVPSCSSTSCRGLLGTVRGSG